MATTVENNNNNNNNLKLKVKKLSQFAFIPYRASTFAAGYDLISAYDAQVKSKDKEIIKTDIAISIPIGYYGRVAPRSSLAWKNFIDVGAGVIDSDYRGNIAVILFNHSNQNFEVKRGDRIAQLIIEKIATPDIEEVEQLEETERADGGFGSTGINIHNN
eukprot:TRINITY_DN1450_c0_g1_i2.p1 TRINITY_DN1450_c0_g1~~TRINITY_DN1450_c0_g1_i2.p1  ORF type:complete len:178 (-),score=82.78 TRINITY_DN1450_c0_g1_i2:120-599(-)